MTASSAVPAAQAKVDIDKDRNGNFKLKLEARHLANPANLSPAAIGYVVWIQARDKAPISHWRLTKSKAPRKRGFLVTAIRRNQIRFFQ